MNPKNLLYFLGGMAIGGFLAWYLSKEKYEEESKTAIEEVKRYYKKLEDEMKTGSEEKTVTINAPDVGAEVHAPYEVVTTLYSSPNVTVSAPIRYNDILGLEPEEDEEEENEDYDPVASLAPEEPVGHPYVIDESSFVQENSHYDKVGLFYYDIDDVITDENFEPIKEWDRLIGPDIGARFKLQDRSDERFNYIYIRNDDVGADYEICLKHESFY